MRRTRAAAKSQRTTGEEGASSSSSSRNPRIDQRPVETVDLTKDEEHIEANLREDSPAASGEEIDEDDLCPICQLLLCNPVITDCRHTLCKSCMATWAEVSLAAPMTVVSVNEEPRDFDVATGLEARCPMCRTQTSASLDEQRSRALRLKYPRAYAERQAEESVDEESHASIQTITVYIGNRHVLVEPESVGSPNMHEWTFLVRPSRTDIIKEVQISLHPTFRPSRIVRTRPPYEICRLGWGTFNIVASVMVKPGYSWVSSDAVNSPDGAVKGMLPLEWMLDFEGFDGTGSMGRCRLKVKNERYRRGVGEEQRRDQAESSRVLRSYRRGW